MYCIYSDKEYNEAAMNIEHIFPLALGGCDDFTIMVEKGINSDLGNQIDGKLSEDFLIKLTRAKNNIRGHSRKTVRLDVRGRVSGHPSTYSLTHKGSTIFDHILRKNLTGKIEMQMSVKFDLALRLRFVCKVALAAGYFLFGKRFVQYVDCESLRQTMLSETIEGFSPRIRYYDSFTDAKNVDKPMVDACEYLFKLFGKSAIVFSYHSKGIIIFVSINGEYIGSVNVDADTELLVSSDSNTLGRVLVCDTKLEIYELRDAIQKLYDVLRNVKEKEA